MVTVPTILVNSREIKNKTDLKLYVYELIKNKSITLQHVVQILN